MHHYGRFMRGFLLHKEQYGKDKLEKSKGDC